MQTKGVFRPSILSWLIKIFSVVCIYILAYTNTNLTTALMSAGIALLALLSTTRNVCWDEDMLYMNNFFFPQLKPKRFPLKNIVFVDTEWETPLVAYLQIRIDYNKAASKRLRLRKDIAEAFFRLLENKKIPFKTR